MVNQFLIGDIVEVCFEPKAKQQEWTRFLHLPIRDNDDLEWVKQLVATNGAFLGWASEALENQGRGWKFRTVTP